MPIATWFGGVHSSLWPDKTDCLIQIWKKPSSSGFTCPSTISRRTSEPELDAANESQAGQKARTDLTIGVPPHSLLGFPPPGFLVLRFRASGFGLWGLRL